MTSPSAPAKPSANLLDYVDSTLSNEAWYDQEVAPVLVQLGLSCKARGMSLIAVTEYGPGERASVQQIEPTAGLAMQMLRINVNAGENFDSYVINFMRWAKAQGVSLDASLIAKKINAPAR